MRDVIISAIENFEINGCIFDRRKNFKILDENTFSFVADGDVGDEDIGKTFQVEVREITNQHQTKNEEYSDIHMNTIYCSNGSTKPIDLEKSYFKF